MILNSSTLLGKPTPAESKLPSKDCPLPIKVRPLSFTSCLVSRRSRGQSKGIPVACHWGLSKYYSGKSKSFVNLLDISTNYSVEVLAKPEHYLDKRMRIRRWLKKESTDNSIPPRPLSPLSDVDEYEEDDDDNDDGYDSQQHKADGGDPDFHVLNIARNISCRL